MRAYSFFKLKGFTLLELLVVMGIIILLAALILSVISITKSRAYIGVCTNNLRQLQMAWQAYADDHKGKIVNNWSILSPRSLYWISTEDSWLGPNNAKHDAWYDTIQQGLFYKLGYVTELRLYHCPADKSRPEPPQYNTKLYLETIEYLKKYGAPILTSRRTRSYSLHGVLGGRTNEQQTVALWGHHILNPSKIFGFIDEQEDSIDDGHFLVWPIPDDRWVNMPADRHNKGVVLSFVDGHVEQWKWKWTKQFKEKESYWKRVENEADLQDLRRLQEASFIKLDFKRQP